MLYFCSLVHAESDTDWFVARAPAYDLKAKISLLKKQKTNAVNLSQTQKKKQIHVSELFSEAHSGIAEAQLVWRDDSGLLSLKSNDHGFIDIEDEVSDGFGILYHPHYLYRRFFLSKDFARQFVEMIPLKIAEKFGYEKENRGAFLLVYLDSKDTERFSRKDKYMRFFLKPFSNSSEEPIEGHFLFSLKSSWVVFPQVPSGDYFLSLVTYSDHLKDESEPFEEILNYFNLSEYEGRTESIVLEKKQQRLGAQLFAFGSSKPIRSADIEILGMPELKTKTDKQGRFAFQIPWDCNKSIYIKIKKERYLSSISKLQCDQDTGDLTKKIPKIFLMELNEAQQIQEQVSIPREALHGTLIFGRDGRCIDLNETKEIDSKIMVLEDHKYKIALNPLQDKNDESYDFYYDEEGLLDPDLETTALNQRYVVLDAPPGFSYLKSTTPRGESVSVQDLYVEKGGAYSVPCIPGP